MTIDLRRFDVVDSTNAECRRIADGGYGGNIWIVSGEQSAGRGRRGREWVSRPGNFFASLLYAIDCDLRTASQLSFVAALAVRDVVADILQSNDSIKCKWPNDILVGGKKISGILLETTGLGGETPSHVIIGIGINVSHYPHNPQYPATSLKDEGYTVEPELVMDRLARSMAHWISRWKDHGFSLIRQAWKDNARGLGQDIIVRLPDEELRGRFVDLDDNGALILEFDGERRHITAGDVFFA
ncbi:MAG: biotin--[acetyl-CoA-carboxylase] ligase [Alphaproteobacteria bacterium]|nr:MAG: biotin--[acetyl-CoA-carboxylase] ligase [Alphaproteobacteria bacterium]